MKAQEVFKIARTVQTKEDQETELKRQKRIDSTLYKPVFDMIAQEAYKGKFEVKIHLSKIGSEFSVIPRANNQSEKNFIGDFRFLGYSLQREKGSSFIKISWDISLEDLKSKAKKSCT